MKNQYVGSLKQYIKKFSQDIKSYSDYYKFGFERFGPFLYGYTNWLYKKIVKSGCKKVFFFSRDGYMMKKAFDIYNSDNTISMCISQEKVLGRRCYTSFQNIRIP